MLCKNILYFAFVAFYCVGNKLKKERNLEACSERTKISGDLTVLYLGSSVKITWQ